MTLLDNALKFTTEGSVKLSVNVDMEKMQAVYTVEDTGSGIEAADQEHIFEPYVKLNQFFDGDGIGLTVARNIARRLGGDLTLDAEYVYSNGKYPFRYKRVLPDGTTAYDTTAVRQNGDVQTIRLEGNLHGLM